MVVKYVNLLVISPVSQGGNVWGTPFSHHFYSLICPLEQFFTPPRPCHTELLGYNVGVWLEGIISIIITHHVKLLVKWNEKKQNH